MNEGSILRRVGTKMFVTSQLRKVGVFIMVYREDTEMEDMTSQHITYVVIQSLILM